MSSDVVKENYSAILESNPLSNLSPSFFKNEYKDFINQQFKKDKKSYLKLLKKNHSIYLNSKNLSNKLKIDFCSAERHLMKLYLKEVMLKLTKD